MQVQYTHIYNYEQVRSLGLSPVGAAPRMSSKSVLLDLVSSDDGREVSTTEDSTQSSSKRTHADANQYIGAWPAQKSWAE